ncbi:hypothetical protein FSP39_005031 [Pinctada imbricata]|uniref:Endonuclease n=1 Tax=Pinctada imbricata TaxID=66713 RepID=A0AA89BK84_PINIB|nr:hypothetical protein FSP39_005031 [Pinctada imbricata]
MQAKQCSLKSLSYDGVYVQGKLNGIKIIYTADTGATKTVISRRSYLKIPKGRRPTLTKCTDTITGAGGKPIQKMGKAKFEIELGPLCFQRELVIANIEDDALLGIDILQNEEGGAADILLSEGIIKFMRKSIPCIQIGLPGRERRVTASQSYHIPPYSEMVINAEIERNEEEYHDLIIEPSENFKKNCNLLMASTVVNIAQKMTAPVRVLNPFSHEVVLYANTTIGVTGECLVTSEPLVENEDASEEENLQPIDNEESLKCGPCPKCKKRLVGIPEPSFVRQPRKTDSTFTAKAVETRSHVEKDATFWTTISGTDATKMQQLQNEDPDIKPVYQWKLQKTKPSKTELAMQSPATRHYCLMWESLELQNNVLVKIHPNKDGLGDDTQLITPKKLQPAILFHNHESMMSGHLGANRTWKKTHAKLYWYEMRKDIAIYVQKCDNCAVNKPLPKSPKSPLGSTLVSAPLDRLAIDIMGPLPRTKRGNRYILVIIDCFTKWVEIFPIMDQTAPTCADRLMDVICRFGCPLSIHSDQGRTFESDIFKELCAMLEIRKTRSSPRNPKCNGTVERFNKTLTTMIRAYIREEETEWDLNLDCLAAAYRATPCASTGLSPNFLMLGREVCLPVDIIFGQPKSYEGNIITKGSYLQELREKMNKAHAIARKHLQQSANYHKCRYDQKASISPYNPGDYVLYLHEERKEGECSKLHPLYHGPFVVVQRINDLVYRIQMDSQGKMKVVNYNKLKPYKGEKLPKWGQSAVKKFQALS